MNLRWYSKSVIPSHYKSRRRIFGKWLIGTTVVAGGAFIAHEVYTTGDRVSMYSVLSDVDRQRQTSFIYLDESKVSYDSKKSKVNEEKFRNQAGHWFSWLQTYSDNPWLILRLAQSQNPLERHLGLKALTDRHGWTNADYRHIAQAADYKTLVSLARMPNCDLRFFLSPPAMPPKFAKVSTTENFHALLSSLPRTNNSDSCIEYFTSLALHSQQNKIIVAAEKGSMLSYGEDTNPQAYYKQLRSPPDEVVDKLYIQALISHSMIESHCTEIVQHGGLLLLQQMLEKWHDNEQIQCAVARIISNLSSYKNLHLSLYRSGWLSILSKWMHSSCLELSMHATKTLANMDIEIKSDNFKEGIYLVYPQYLESEEIYADIIFIHGLLGGPFKTWRERDPISIDDNKQNNFQESVQLPVKKSLKWFASEVPYTYCWPKDWLAKDFPKVRILTVEYDTHLSFWAPKCPLESNKHSLLARSEQLLQKLIAAGLGKRPIIWVSHSLGGLLVKQILIDCIKEPQFSEIVNQSKGLIFYSVPHRGSPIAAYSSQAKFLLLPSVEVKELTQDSPHLLELHQEFLQLVRDYHIPCLSFGETEKTWLGLNLKIILVPSNSADPGVGDFFKIPVNHQNICKPDSRSSHLYTLLVKFISQIIPQAQADVSQLEFDATMY